MQVGKGNLQLPLLRASRCQDRAMPFLNTTPRRLINTEVWRLSGRTRITADGCLGSLCNAKKHLSCNILTGETSGPPVSPRLGVSALFNANVSPW